MLLSTLVITHFPLDAASAAGRPMGLPPAPTPAAALLDMGFNKIGVNMITSIESLPGLLTGTAYMFALGLGVKGIIRIKDHVENPRQYPLKDATAMLLAGGALFALPIVYESMFSSMGEASMMVETAALNRVTFNVDGMPPPAAAPPPAAPPPRGALF